MTQRKALASNVIYSLDENKKNLSISPQDVAAYSASMLVALSRLAKEANMDMLAYLLDMALLEAENQLK